MSNSMKKSTNTAAWRFQVWASFALSAIATGTGILYLPVDAWTKGFLGMGLFFTIGSCFSLAKTIRDDAEETRLDAPAERAHPFRSAA